MGRPDSLSYTIFIVSVVLFAVIGFVVVYKLQRDVDEDSCTVTDDDLLKEFERAYYSGELSQDEFLRVTAALRGKNVGGPTVPKEPVPPRFGLPGSEDPSEDAEPTGEV